MWLLTTRSSVRTRWGACYYFITRILSCNKKSVRTYTHHNSYLLPVIYLPILRHIATDLGRNHSRLLFSLPGTLACDGGRCCPFGCRNSTLVHLNTLTQRVKLESGIGERRGSSGGRARGLFLSSRGGTLSPGERFGRLNSGRWASQDGALRENRFRDTSLLLAFFVG